MDLSHPMLFCPRANLGDIKERSDEMSPNDTQWIKPEISVNRITQIKTNPPTDVLQWAGYGNLCVSLFLSGYEVSNSFDLVKNAVDLIYKIKDNQFEIWISLSSI